MRIFTSTLLFVLAVVSCRLPTGDNIRLDPGQFWAQRVDNNRWYIVDTNLVYNAPGGKCRIYLEKGRSLTSAALTTIYTEFNNSIYPMVETNYGSPSDVDNNGKITILILDIKDGYSAGGGYVAGYFHPINEYIDRHSNEREMLYMDCSPGNPGDEIFNYTMAHEFQHLVNYNQKVFVQGVGPQDIWINEGLSTSAEDLYLGHRISERIDSYSSSDITQGQNFVSWGARGGYLGYYSTAYLFFQWLRIHSGSTAIYKKIIDNPNRDAEAVREEAVASISSLSGTSWEDILRDWYAANLFKTTGIHGYGGDAAFNHSVTSLGGVSGTEYSLFPGEGIYLSIGTPASIVSSGSIKYAGLDTAGNTIDTTGDDYSGNYLLCFNVNPNRFGPTENTGVLPSVVLKRTPNFSAFNKKISSNGKIKQFPLDVVYNLDGSSSLKINKDSKK